MAKFQFDKKQLPAVFAMAVASVGLFGYFFWKINTPPPLQAAPKAQVASAHATGSHAPKTTAPGGTGTNGANNSNAASGTSGTNAANTTQDTADAQAPDPTARNPFTPAIVDTGSAP